MNIYRWKNPNYKGWKIVFACVFVFLASATLAFCFDINHRPNYLVVVDDSHQFEPDYLDTVELVEAQDINGAPCQLERKTRWMFDMMKADLEKQGITIGIKSAYRDQSMQEQFITDFAAQHGERYANVLCEKPNVSEHQTGLALDIALQIDQGQWLLNDADIAKHLDTIEIIHQTLPRYGFILSHDYLLWHIRYIDDPVKAQKIMDQQITLAECLKQV